MMFNIGIIKSITGALSPRLFFVLVFGALLVPSSSPTALAQSVMDGFYLRTNNAMPATGELADNVIYLPLLMKNFPLTPDAPMLNAISNEDGDGNYTVSWSSSEGANTYTLQEDVSADFSNPTTVYSGSSTSTAISGKNVGTHYYRVRASNSYASSVYSNVESVEVTEPLADCPQTEQWYSTTSQGYPISFVVENSPRCQIEFGSLSIKYSNTCGISTQRYLIDIPITNNRFTTVYYSSGVEGSFSSSSTAEGTFAFNSPDPWNPGGWCSCSGTWAAPTNAANGSVSALVVQADGKIVVGGAFTTLGGQLRDGIARLNPDGTLDTAFDPGPSGAVSALALQADGKIVVGGSFTELGGQTRDYIGRLNPDGTLDAAFNPGADDRVRALALQADGKIVVGGEFTTMHGETRNYIARLNTDGTLDAAFNPGEGRGWVSTLAVQADGKILVGGGFWNLGGQLDYIGRLNPEGTLDAAFDPGVNGEVHALAVQADGKILVGGSFWELGGEPRNEIGRLNPDGTLDAAFDPGANNIVRAVAVQADGKILVGGSFTMLGGQQRSYIGRLNPDGTLDTSFPIYAIHAAEK